MSFLIRRGKKSANASAASHHQQQQQQQRHTHTHTPAATLIICCQIATDAKVAAELDNTASVLFISVWWNPPTIHSSWIFSRMKRPYFMLCVAQGDERESDGTKKDFPRDWLLGRVQELGESVKVPQRVAATRRSCSRRKTVSFAFRYYQASKLQAWLSGTVMTPNSKPGFPVLSELQTPSLAWRAPSFSSRLQVSISGTFTSDFKSRFPAPLLQTPSLDFRPPVIPGSKLQASLSGTRPQIPSFDFQHLFSKLHTSGSLPPTSDVRFSEHLVQTPPRFGASFLFDD